MSPIALSLGWHSRSKGTPYFLQAFQNGPKRSTSSSRLTWRTSGRSWPAGLCGKGGKRINTLASRRREKRRKKEEMTQERGRQTNKPQKGFFVFCSLPR